ncbi:hypothetical protein [Marinobacterium rhizophilum]|uniref:Acetyl-CoA acetyltransferase n=1 Tax=Marinobacterium rhizophilum TaxID=420402 RepID=A0ABY5HLN0_9GAMM|nr:hypothetical protein [Marinobacterium rhizophilum]UTW12869.1 hypothetical protein KDW95_04110 [Marinobacterium rhizophilum]
MSQALIVAAARTQDNQGSLQHCLDLEDRLRARGVALRELVIEPLSTDWHSPEPEDHFRSGCAPIEALSRARELIGEGVPAVLIRGEDLIKSGYSRDDRLRLMAVYGPDYPLTEAYTDLTERFLARQDHSSDSFRDLARGLFDNYRATFLAQASHAPGANLPAEHWFEPVTRLFRGVDCANPMVDFSGRLLVCTAALADDLGVGPDERIEIRGVGLRRLAGDGRDYIDEIAGYDHLRQAYRDSCEMAGIDFAARFRAGDALLEAYTCFPVVPMAFLLVSGLVDVLDAMPDFLARHSVTITGGMNLARGAWNNPALNALISMHHRLLQGEEHIGLVHGNGGLGYRQGVALLART